MKSAFSVGDRVRVIRSAFCSGRSGVVSNVTTNNLGTVLYWLKDGGCFSAAELQADPLLSDRWRKVYGLPKSASV